MIDKGSKVVCIKDDEWPSWARALMNNFPVKDKVYTIRDVIPGVIGKDVIKDSTGQNPIQFFGPVRPTFLLEEIHNPIHPVYKNEYAFDSARFAPLIEPPVQAVKKKESKPRPKKVSKTKKKELIDV